MEQNLTKINKILNLTSDANDTLMRELLSKLEK
jgi:hypothetical protein